MLDNARKPLNSCHMEYTSRHRADHHPIMPCERRAAAQLRQYPWQGQGRELRRAP